MRDFKIVLGEWSLSQVRINPNRLGYSTRVGKAC